MTRYWWVGLIILVVGFGIGRASVPTVDTVRADSLVVTKPAHDSTREATRDSVAAEKARADSAEAIAREASRRASRALSVADSAAGVVASLRTALDSAKTKEDSLRLRGEQVEALTAENGQLRVAVRSIAEARDSAFAANVDLRRAIGRLEDQVTRDSVRLEVYQSVVDGLRKAHSGCRVPILKIKCPVIGPGYSATLAGGQVHHGPSLNVIYPLIGR